MAIPSTTWFEVQSAGSDTLNSGCFDTATTGKATDLTAVTATSVTPVVSSASYVFTSADVNNWLFVPAGTNWLAGWFKISSVASGLAMLNASIGAAVLLAGTPNTVAGCATVASPTGGTWAVDYSQQGSVQFSLTGLTSSASNAIILTSAATKAMVGNGIVITGGANATTGRYIITAATVGVSLTVDRTWGTAAVSGGTAGLGGALATPGQAGAHMVSGNTIWMTGTFTTTSTSSNVSNGVFAPSSVWCRGYGAVRGDSGKAIVQAGVNSVSLFNYGNSSGQRTENIIWKGNGFTGCTGYAGGSDASTVYNCEAYNLIVGFSSGSGNGEVTRCYAETCTSGFATGGLTSFCVAKSCTSGFPCMSAVLCLAYSCTTGFGSNRGQSVFANCTAYSCTTGFGNSSGTNSYKNTAINCIATNCSGYGFDFRGFASALYNCAGYSNTGNVQTVTTPCQVIGFITLSASPFTNAASGDFSLNNTAGGGALCRAAGILGISASGLITNYLDIGAYQHHDSGGIKSRGILTGGRL